VITVPESLSFYWSDPANMAAVNVLADVEAVPADLTLHEAERFTLATLAASRVRVEFWRFLRQLWSATWGEAVGTAFPLARLLTYGEHEDFGDEDDYATPSVDFAWEDRATTGVFDLRGGRSLFTYIGFANGDREIEMKFYVFDPDEGNATSDGLDLGANWTDDGESQRITRPGLVTFASRDHEIDTKRLASLASDAAVALSAAVR